MDYEQKYKEALEKVKKFKETCDNVAIISWCEYIFPELKESKEEKIRKELIQYLKDYPNLPNGQYSRNDFFTWLEKQTELESMISWKPTEKQINAIKLARSFVTDDFGSNPTLSETLKELTKQLENLI